MLFFTHSFTDAGTSAVVTADGQIYGTYSLSSDRTVEINTEYGRNVLTIENGSAYMSEADCSGKDCMSFGKINRPGQVILCLPHKVSVTISGEGGTDAISF